MKKSQLEYGPVLIEGFFDDIRIGYYDDDDSDDNKKGVVFLGDMYLSLGVGHYLIPYKNLRTVTTDDLWRRKEKIEFEIGGRLLRVPKEGRPPFEDRYRLLLELAYIENILMDRLFIARFDAKKNKGRKVFISHSSKDKQFAKWLSVDLANAGHRPWLDGWEIRAGDSIPTQIGIGIEECQFVLLLLSKKSVSSHWVEREWQAKYWKEAQDNEVMVIPVLIEDCDIPILLQTKRYADFRTDYTSGLETLLASLLRSSTRKRLTTRSTRTRRKRRAG